MPHKLEHLEGEVGSYPSLGVSLKKTWGSRINFYHYLYGTVAGNNRQWWSTGVMLANGKCFCHTWTKAAVMKNTYVKNC